MGSGIPDRGNKTINKETEAWNQVSVQGLADLFYPFIFQFVPKQDLRLNV